ncbi:hypothetical protein [Lichenibacterium ramalinae]|uniref:TnsA endonuclease N-terminal domain-containing protein n=1 Tax=Lichenibacterium ramalinae TaxID=2316527 RepID=A0A4Q2RB39_9HYPH|nr:hypothetical protein [Lichenibacterium ramalinae]RYB02118.1 hypothetical protein D3272_22620 [Lichenibacterium ramalinae]
MALYSEVFPPDFGLSKGALPVRVIPRRSGRPTMPGRFPTKKGTLDSLRGETNLEMDGFGHFEVNPRCRLMAAQPHRLHFEEHVPGRGTKIRTYVPDLAIRMDDGRVAVVDFKLAKYAMLPKWKARADVLTRCYADRGAVFSTVTSDVLRIEPRASNVRVMLQRRPWHMDAEAEAAVDAAIAILGLPATVAAIAAKAALSQPHPHTDRAFSRIVEMAILGLVTLELDKRLGPGTVVGSAPARAPLP